MLAAGDVKELMNKVFERRGIEFIDQRFADLVAGVFEDLIIDDDERATLTDAYLSLKTGQVRHLDSESAYVLSQLEVLEHTNNVTDYITTVSERLSKGDPLTFRERGGDDLFRLCALEAKIQLNKRIIGALQYTPAVIEALNKDTLPWILDEKKFDRSLLSRPLIDLPARSWFNNSEEYVNIVEVVLFYGKPDDYSNQRSARMYFELDEDGNLTLLD